MTNQTPNLVSKEQATQNLNAKVLNLSYQIMETKANLEGLEKELLIAKAQLGAVQQIAEASLSPTED